MLIPKKNRKEVYKFLFKGARRAQVTWLLDRAASGRPARVAASRPHIAPMGWARSRT
jgi:hypothetical protein